MNTFRKRVTSLLSPKSLRYQLLSRSFMIIAALLLLIGVFQYLYMQQFLYKNRAETIISQVISSPMDIWTGQGGSGAPAGQGSRGAAGGPGGPGGNGGAAGPPVSGGPGGPGGPAGSSNFFFPDATLAFYNANGDFILISENENVGPTPRFEAEIIMPYLLNSKKDAHYQVMTNEQRKEQLVVLVPLQNRGRVVGLSQLSVLTAPLKQVLLQQLLTFLALSTGAMIFGLLTYLPLLRKTLVPLSNMVDTVEKIDAGNLDERFPASQGQLEIDRLAVSFNRMLERLGASFQAEKEAKEQMSRFIADASHELRTPLTSIHGFLEILLRGASNNPEQLDKALRSMLGESERINKLVRDLLALARMDREPGLQMKEGLLDEVILEMEPQLRVLAGERDVRFTLAPGVSSRFDHDKIKQVLLNLFHNAVQHTDPEHGMIEVGLHRTPGGVQLSVKDNGHGIPEEHLPYLFDRFYRVDSSRTRKLGGSGLGLAITKSIVESHGGTIEVSSTPGTGSLFRVMLPESKIV